jgi:hypothetical protein
VRVVLRDNRSISISSVWPRKRSQDYEARAGKRRSGTTGHDSKRKLTDHQLKNKVHDLRDDTIAHARAVQRKGRYHEAGITSIPFPFFPLSAFGYTPCARIKGVKLSFQRLLSPSTLLWSYSEQVPIITTNPSSNRISLGCHDSRRSPGERFPTIHDATLCFS